jgi:hypothetical protein
VIYDSRPDTWRHIWTVQNLLRQVIRDLLDRQREHDQSKLEEPELSLFNEYTPKLKGSTYGSEEYEGFRKGMGPALDHHYANNRHHPEFFNEGIIGMNLVDLLEMLADWKAATLRHDNGDLRKSIEINQKRFGYGDEIKRALLNTADDMGWLDER